MCCVPIVQHVRIHAVAVLGGLALCFLVVGVCSVEEHLKDGIALLGPRQSPEVQVGLIVRLCTINVDQGCINKLLIGDRLVCICRVGGCVLDMTS